ncbi:hypothetical protein KP509_30G057300 [Ceratopteris richardii]|uniref:Uncharacterized protein n=1 Tax=Ceratopteris richardii TaxID=49495 RepID=A0A8T2R3P5_CERRI|nr:hypothetical protein KP509_30G057300 [Ceratopteris richardii]
MLKKRAASSSTSASPRMKSSTRPFISPSSSLSRCEAVELGHRGLSLVPRLRILLSFTRADLSVRPLDEWQLRQTLLSFLHDSLSISVSEKDLALHKHKNPQKRRSDEALASGVLYIWDVQALVGDVRIHKENADSILHEKEHIIINKLTGLELNLGNLRLRCHARPEDRDDFSALKQSWNVAYDALEMGSPDTMVLRGIPSQWLAELRVSSKASILVTHTILSQFGAIRNLDIQVNDSESLSCNIWVQFEHYSEFYDAILAFCGRSMVKEGSSFKANYEVSWDNDGYFTEASIRKRKFEQQRLEDLQRRQAATEARQAEIARRQAELARFEQEKREAERAQRLREEENWRRERESALADQEMLRQRQLEELKEERLRNERIQRERVQREEEQKTLEIRRREEQRRPEDKIHERKIIDVDERENWTKQNPRYASPETVKKTVPYARFIQDMRKQVAKTGREESRQLGRTGRNDNEEWTQEHSRGSSKGDQEYSHDREYHSRLFQGHSSFGWADVIVEDSRDSDLQRWVLDTGPSPLKFVGFKLEANSAYSKRLGSVIVDDRWKL